MPKEKVGDVSSHEEEDDWLLVEETMDESLLEAKVKLPPPSGPSSGVTSAVLQLITDLEALMKLTLSEKPDSRVIRGKVVLTAYYGFGDASSGGFGTTIEREYGVYGRFGLWGTDEESASSNYRELCNLVDTVEVEASEGNLQDTEL